MKKEIQIENHKYRLVEEYKDGFNQEDVSLKYTDYFDDFDYIFGDYSYDKLRLKGFYSKENPKCREINNIEKIDDYIRDYCAFECRHFLLEKVDSEKN